MRFRDTTSFVSLTPLDDPTGPGESRINSPPPKETGRRPSRLDEILWKLCRYSFDRSFLSPVLCLPVTNFNSAGSYVCIRRAWGHTQTYSDVLYSVINEKADADRVTWGFHRNTIRDGHLCVYHAREGHLIFQEVTSTQIAKLREWIVCSSFGSAGPLLCNTFSMGCIPRRPNLSTCQWILSYNPAAFSGIAKCVKQKKLKNKNKYM